MYNIIINRVRVDALGASKSNAFGGPLLSATTRFSLSATSSAIDGGAVLIRDDRVESVDPARSENSRIRYFSTRSPALPSPLALVALSACRLSPALSLTRSSREKGSREDMVGLLRTALWGLSTLIVDSRPLSRPQLGRA